MASMSTRLNHGLRDAQKVCALTKVGTVLKSDKYYVLLTQYSVLFFTEKCDRRCNLPLNLKGSYLVPRMLKLEMTLVQVRTEF